MASPRNRNMLRSTLAIMLSQTARSTRLAIRALYLAQLRIFPA
jgi:hypothetical protein